MIQLDESDQTFVHIQWIDNTHFNYIVYQRRDVAPFDFRPRLIYHCLLVNGSWQLTSTEVINDE